MRRTTRTARSGRDVGEISPLADAASTDTEVLVEALTGLDLEGLPARWRTETGRTASTYRSKALLLRMLAYRIQADRHGDLDADTSPASSIGSQPLKAAKVL